MKLHSNCLKLKSPKENDINSIYKGDKSVNECLGHNAQQHKITTRTTASIQANQKTKDTRNIGRPIPDSIKDYSLTPICTKQSVDDETQSVVSGFLDICSNNRSELRVGSGQPFKGNCFKLSYNTNCPIVNDESSTLAAHSILSSNAHHQKSNSKSLKSNVHASLKVNNSNSSTTFQIKPSCSSNQNCLVNQINFTNSNECTRDKNETKCCLSINSEWLCIDKNVLVNQENHTEDLIIDNKSKFSRKVKCKAKLERNTYSYLSLRVDELEEERESLLAQNKELKGTIAQLFEDNKTLIDQIALEKGYLEKVSPIR